MQVVLTVETPSRKGAYRMSIDWGTYYRRLIENDPNSTPDMKSRVLAMLARAKAEEAAHVESDPAVWEQAREFKQAMDDTLARFLAREIDGDTYQRETKALLDAVPENARTAANSIQRAMLASFRDPDPSVH